MNPTLPEVRAWRSRRPAIAAYELLQTIVSPPLRFLFRVRREGASKVPRQGAAIFAVNHVSYIDPVLVIASIRRPLFHLAMRELFKRGFGSYFFEHLGGQILVDRERGGNEAAIEAARKVLDHGHCLAIYPEGARSPDQKVGKGRTGVARLAFLTGAPIFPVAVEGSYEVWPRGRKRPHMFRPTAVLVGDAIVVAKEPAAAENPARCRELTDRVMTAIAGLLGQPYDPARARPVTLAAGSPAPKG